MRENDPTNYYGDPPSDDDPITDPKCIFSKDNHEGPQSSNSAPHRRRSLTSSLSPRVVTKQPLRDPKDDSQDAFEHLMTSILSNAQEHGRDLALGIEPSDSQVEHWTINYNKVDIPIGATGEWRSFGSEPQEYATWGLHGCTASIVALYIGKGARNAGEKVQGTRSTKEFQAIAVDILGQVTPTEERQNRYTWISMADLKQYYNDPFPDSSHVDVWFMTLAKSLTDKDRQYGRHIDQLKAKFAEIFPGSHYSQNTYPGWSAGDYKESNKQLPMPEGISVVTGPSPTISTPPATNCQACTLTGGIADSDKCTSVTSCTPTGAAPTPTPTFAFFVSNSTVDVGNAEHEDQGKQLGQNMYKGLHDFCQNPSSSIVMSDGENPYANLLEIQIDFETGGNGVAQVLCEMLVQGLTDAAIALAPELAPEEITEELEFDTVCGEL
ncbi:hypothetical protein SCUP234_10245 [Seiridium cupressi]